MKNKLICILTTFCVVLSIVGSQAEALTSAFTDITGNWAEDVIDRWTEYGVLTAAAAAPTAPGRGRGRAPTNAAPTVSEGALFRPNDLITRGELATFISNLMRYETTTNMTIHDIGIDGVLQSESDAIRKCVAAGVMQGNSGYLRPNERITREETAVMIGRAFDIVASENPSASFRDQNDLSGWAKNLVLTMKEKGYLFGRTEDNFYPKENITRAEALKMLDNVVLNGLYYEEGVYTISSAGNVVINTDGVEISGATITGDLILSEGVGDSGVVILNDVTVNGCIYVHGGEELVLNGQTKIGDIRQLKIRDEFKITGGNAGIIEKISVAPGSGPMTFTGAIRELNITAANNKFNLENAVVMSVLYDAYNSQIIMDDSSYISTLTAKQPIIVVGQGRIGYAEIEGGASGSSFEMHPNVVTVPTETNVFLASNEYANSSGGNKVYRLPTDSTPPVMGNSSLVASDIKEDSMKISWTAASDNTTTRARLKYMLYYSHDKFGMDTVEGLETNATPANSVFSPNLLSHTVTRLKSDTSYYFNVVVMDEYGNKSCYTPLNIGLEGDNYAPTIWSPDLVIDPLTNTITWQKAQDVDNLTPASYLRYTVYQSESSDLYTVYDWIESGEVLMPPTRDVTSFTMESPPENVQLFITVVVQDEAGNSTRYEVESFAIDKKAPTLPNDIDVEITSDGYLTWGAASDTDGEIYGTASHLLRYYVYSLTEEDDSNSIESIMDTGFRERDSMDITASNVSLPPEGETYTYAIIVQDERGNMTLYPKVELSGPEPEPTPTP